MYLQMNSPEYTHDIDGIKGNFDDRLDSEESNNE